MVKVLHTVQYPESQFIPHFIELPFAYSEPEVAAELQAWGLSSKIFLCGENDAIFAMFDNLPNYEDDIYIYCGSGDDLDTNLLLRAVTGMQDETQHMKFLHHHGATRAVIKNEETWGHRVKCIHFDDVQPQHDVTWQTPRTRSPWSAPQPSITTKYEPFALHALSTAAPSCLLKFNLDELRLFWLREGLQHPGDPGFHPRCP